MKRRHNMPFGAECRDDGTVRFRLWAPAARSVELCLQTEKSSIHLPLNEREGGWLELVTDAARVGSDYFFRIDNRQAVPDPASRFQARDVHGPSEVVDPGAFEWRDDSWCGRPWQDAVIYELHVGAFSRSGSFAGVTERLDYLAEIGVTALELMPIADFPGQRNWGYDGALPFAPDATYGRPEDLKNLVQAAHERGLMVLLDVVYNHFGPEGNYLRAYAPQFFTDRHRTPWGDAINFDGSESGVVRDFFIHNALYWLTEYHMDGLRFDAVHAIIDDSPHHILAELSGAVRNALGRDRHVHLVLENEANQARYLRRTANCRPAACTAQWNDDIHHALHVLITGERDGYYVDYAERPVAHVGRCLTKGFAYQGEVSVLRSTSRGESTHGLPPTAFVSFLQNHDQVGNRAFGERIVKLADRRAVRAAMAILLLAPSPPLLFMGEEFGAETPFLFFCDFEPELARAVSAGRRNEFAHFARFGGPAVRGRIPDPNAAETFASSHLDWSGTAQPEGRDWLRFYRHLLSLRREHIVPRLSHACAIPAEYKTHDDHGLVAHWRFPDESKLVLLANLGDRPLCGLGALTPHIFFASDEIDDALKRGTLPAWSVVWCLES
ncbi:MAG TPA: malto-oligosyltrehalose trehalohydrolase [Terriglobales bacterium]|nr:malto-oligosyltrehalose trehalohydrolase [Terriglobales bacterium]